MHHLPHCHDAELITEETWKKLHERYLNPREQTSCNGGGKQQWLVLHSNVLATGQAGELRYRSFFGRLLEGYIIHYLFIQRVALAIETDFGNVE